MKRKLKWNRRQMVLNLWTVVPLVLFSVLFLIPVGMGLNYSFTDWNGLTQTYNYIGFENYVNLFSNSRIRASLTFTGKYTVFLVVIVMVIAMSLTLALTYLVSHKFRTLFRSIFFFPAVLSLVTVGLVWNQILYRVLPQVGQSLGIDWLSTNLLGSPDTAMWGILLIHIWQGTAIPFVILLAGIQNVPGDMYEAARIDGAGPWRLFTKITVPFMLPTINVAFVMVLKGGITVFDYIQSTTAGGPMRTTESAAVLIYRMAFQDSRAGLSSAFAFALLLIIAIISFVQMRISAKVEVGQL